MAYDLLIRGGEVIDPANGVAGRRDVAVSGGVVTAVEPEITGEAAETVDATGLVVTPGLVDLHTHVYWGGTFWGIEADPVCAVTGVTTSVDAGSAGAYNWPAFRHFLIGPSRSRIVAFLNISCIGLVSTTHELAHPAYPNVELLVKTVEAHRDTIIGVKARIDANTVQAQGIAPLAKAREAADAVGLPLMVHVGGGPPELGEILAYMRPGDILTHCFTGQGNRITTGKTGNATGNAAHTERVRDDARAARERGVLLDVGHGAGSFSYPVAEAAIADGILPDVISSDIHQLSARGAMRDLPTTLSKFLNLGLSLPQVIERATIAPARAIRRDDTLGTLGVGRAADIAMWRVETGDYTFRDIAGVERGGTQRLANTHTFVDGKPLPRDLTPRRVVWVG